VSGKAPTDPSRSIDRILIALSRTRNHPSFLPSAGAISVLALAYRGDRARRLSRRERSRAARSRLRRVSNLHLASRPIPRMRARSARRSRAGILRVGDSSPMKIQPTLTTPNVLQISSARSRTSELTTRVIAYSRNGVRHGACAGASYVALRCISSVRLDTSRLGSMFLLLEGGQSRGFRREASAGGNRRSEMG